MKSVCKNVCNPFYKIAGYKALVWGVAGIVATTAIAFCSGLHFHGLLHYGGADNQSWWCFVVEHLAVWLVPSILFYGAGLFLSKSHIRPIDVLGTTAFAQLPFVLLTLCLSLPSVRNLFQIQTLDAETLALLVDGSNTLTLVWAGIVSTVLTVWVLCWLFKAVSVSCNLKGRNLWIVYLVGVLGGDIICRWLIGLCY